MSPDPLLPTLYGRPVLVTGASGFLGRHLCRRLDRLGAEVHAVTRRTPGRADLPVRWHVADLGDADAVRALVGEVRPAAVFHLASAVAGRRDEDLALPMLEANTAAAVAVMTAASDLPGCRVVLAGSVEEPRGDEAPVSPYAAAKAAATGYARLYHSQWDLAVTVLRIAMVYGPDQPDATKLVPHVIDSLLDGRAPSLSSGTRPVDWVHVDDVCDAFVAAATVAEAPGLVADIGSGYAVTIAEVVGRIAALTGWSGPLGFGDRDDRADDGPKVADPDPAATELGWRPRVTLDDGLAATVAWHRARRDRRPATSAPPALVAG